MHSGVCPHGGCILTVQALMGYWCRLISHSWLRINRWMALGIIAKILKAFYSSFKIWGYRKWWKWCTYTWNIMYNQGYLRFPNFVYLYYVVRLQYMEETQIGVVLPVLLAMRGFLLTKICYKYHLAIFCLWIKGSHLHLTGIRKLFQVGNLYFFEGTHLQFSLFYSSTSTLCFKIPETLW